ncbi:MAG: hypothetical protein V8R83_09595 [Candidatus Gastranaerophilaceae bacterium]|jgi:hypothetical protein|nr:unknown [Clostridium sp. CAG:306]
MEKSIRTSLSEELFEKVQEMRDSGLNVSQLIRNFLANYPLEQNKERIA